MSQHKNLKWKADFYLGQLEYTINELDKAVPEKLKENLKNITRRIDRVRKKIDMGNLVYRSKDYEYGTFIYMIKL